MVMIATQTQIEHRKGPPPPRQRPRKKTPYLTWEQEAGLPVDRQYGTGGMARANDYHGTVLEMHRECQARGWPFPVVMMEMMERWLANPIKPEDE